MCYFLIETFLKICHWKVHNNTKLTTSDGCCSWQWQVCCKGHCFVRSACTDCFVPWCLTLHAHLAHLVRQLLYFLKVFWSVSKCLLPQYAGSRLNASRASSFTGNILTLNTWFQQNAPLVCGWHSSEEIDKLSVKNSFNFYLYLIT